MAEGAADLRAPAGAPRQTRLASLPAAAQLTAEALLLSIREVASLLHCSIPRVVEAIREGKLAVRRGWRTSQSLVTLADVLRFEDAELPLLDPETWETIRKASPLRRAVKQHG